MTFIAFLPPKNDLESKSVLKKVAEAHRYLAELKGVASSIPNQNILLDTLSLQEARESSAIENIVSTFDEVYKSNAAFSEFVTPAAKEVHTYAKALKYGYELVKMHALLTNNHILQIQEIIEQNKAGFRKVPGTVLKNEQTGKVIYTPPQDYDTIKALMENLETFINNDEMYNADTLIKMAIIHHQFETIHPFYDGNGRTGRIINILYLIKNDLLTLPILYLSRYVIRHKQDYYRLLQQVRDTGEWEEWLLYILNATAQTAKESIALIIAIRETMQEYKMKIRVKGPKIYSQDLLNNLFRYPYTKIEYLMRDLDVSRNTAIRYLEKLQELQLVEKIKMGRDNYYVNKSLAGLLLNPK
jgi:Fic family protein